MAEPTTGELLKAMVDFQSGLTAYLDERFKGIERRLNHVDTHLDGMDRRFEKLEKKFDSLDSWMQRPYRTVQGLVASQKKALRRAPFRLF